MKRYVETLAAVRWHKQGTQLVHVGYRPIYSFRHGDELLNYATPAFSPFVRVPSAWRGRAGP
jgi:hypothetical protein